MSEYERLGAIRMVYANFKEAQDAARTLNGIRERIDTLRDFIEEAREANIFASADDIAAQDTFDGLDAIKADHIAPACMRANKAADRLDPDLNTDAAA